MDLSAEDGAKLIYYGVRGSIQGGSTVVSEMTGSVGVTRSDVVSCSLCLVIRISSSLGSGRWLPEVCLCWGKILTVLVEDRNILAQLVQLFHCEEQVISHLAAKAASCCVSNQLLRSGVVSGEWVRTCVQAFDSCPSGCDVGACLWSLTDVCKKLLKGAQQEILRKLLGYFDCSLCVLYSKFLPGEQRQSDLSHWGTSFCLLLDLLEVLTAAVGGCVPGSSLRSLCGLQQHSSGLLEASCNVSHFHSRRKVVVLLKRAMLQSVGEDLGLGASWYTESTQNNSDQLQLADSVLTALHQDWLGRLEVDSTCFRRWKDGELRAEGGMQRADRVMVRAASLLVLKSVELHFLEAFRDVGPTGVSAVSDVSVVSRVCGYLGYLLGFLQRCDGLQLSDMSHRCCWVSLLFGEQDDDMLEATKALLSIFTSIKFRAGLGEVSVLETSCASGFNPHCHFLLLLQTISFDHSILLDFLISTETCFLEYFVCYLKVLRDDWQGFTTACVTVSSTSSHASVVESFKASYRVEEHAGTSRTELGGFLTRTHEPPVGLVDYDSSESSESESAEVSKPLPGPPAETCMPTLSPQEISYKAVQSLSCLSQVVTRLHTRKLFPYNPASLLRRLSLIHI